LSLGPRLDDADARSGVWGQGSPQRAPPHCRHAARTHFVRGTGHGRDAVGRVRDRVGTACRKRGAETRLMNRTVPQGACMRTDPYIGRIELVEITPESLHPRAIESWK